MIIITCCWLFDGTKSHWVRSWRFPSQLSKLNHRNNNNEIELWCGSHLHYVVLVGFDSSGSGSYLSLHPLRRLSGNVIATFNATLETWNGFTVPNQTINIHVETAEKKINHTHIEWSNMQINNLIITYIARSGLNEIWSIPVATIKKYKMAAMN